jgi:hypothetical protein
LPSWATVVPGAPLALRAAIALGLRAATDTLSLPTPPGHADYADARMDSLDRLVPASWQKMAGEVAMQCMIERGDRSRHQIPSRIWVVVAHAIPAAFLRPTG